MITVVITNYKRPLMLMEAFRSCLQANVKHIVVSSSGEDAAVAAVHRQILALKSDTVITSIKADLGCNETWLRGAKLATTPWTYILHDDDRVLPKFSLLEKDLNNGAGFHHWNCGIHGVHAIKYGVKVHTYFPSLSTGIYTSSYILKIAENVRTLSLSPVSGLFKTEHVVETLTECADNFGQEFLFSEHLLVGNDLLLWLRAAEKYPIFKFHTTPKASYGWWEGSTSGLANAENKLLPIYNRTRSYWLKNKYGTKR